LRKGAEKELLYAKRDEDEVGRGNKRHGVRRDSLVVPRADFQVTSGMDL
jgi:hypothetical protein